MSIYIYNTGNINIGQAPEPDLASEVNSYYGVKKIANQIIENAYITNKNNKWWRLHWCWSHIKIARNKFSGEKKLIFANSCKVRLCPCCAWRRSRKFAIENNLMLQQIAGKYIFLTLTVKNCTGEALSNTIDSILNGWKRFYSRKDIKAIMLGSIRNLEITYNSKTKTFHPHIHILIHTAPSYFGRNYISQKQWSMIWKDCARLDYIPVTDIRRVKTGDNAYLEISKYVAKLSDILYLDAAELAEVVKVLDPALAYRRVIGFTGTFRKWRRDKKLSDDIQDADAFSEGSEEWEVFCFNWIYGKNYYELAPDGAQW